MRDYALFLLVFGSIPFILRRPWLGILMWSFLSYANPHRQTWGIAYSFPFAQLTAITLFAAIALNRQNLSLPKSPILNVWALFMFWIAVTTMLAVFPDQAVKQLEKVYKIQLITLLTILLIKEKRQVIWLVVTICVSIGFYSVKGGLFVIKTAGAFRVWGPAGSFIEDNNALATAILIVIPLAFFLFNYYQDKRLRIAILGCIVLSFFSAVGSQSRGAMLATIAMCSFLALKSKNKALYGLVFVAAIPMLFAFMPQSWHDRMATIRTYEEDGSAMGRLNAWQYSMNIATDRITGGGFESWSSMTFARYAPVPDDVHAAHSIWFGVLGDHGWPGLFLFALVFFLTWRELSRLNKRHRSSIDLQWISDLARMIQVSLVAYFVGGTFLSLAYFDLPWHLMAITIILKRFSTEGAKQPKRAGVGVLDATHLERKGPTTAAANQANTPQPRYSNHGR